MVEEAREEKTGCRGEKTGCRGEKTGCQEERLYFGATIDPDQPDKDLGVRKLLCHARKIALGSAAAPTRGGRVVVSTAAPDSHNQYAAIEKWQPQQGTVGGGTARPLSWKVESRPQEKCCTGTLRQSWPEDWGSFGSTHPQPNTMALMRSGGRDSSITASAVLMISSYGVEDHRLLGQHVGMKRAGILMFWRTQRPSTCR